MGVMKSVGQAVQHGQSFNWDNDRMMHVLRCIGIAPWGYVRNRRLLESTGEVSTAVIVYDDCTVVFPEDWLVGQSVIWLVCGWMHGQIGWLADGWIDMDGGMCLCVWMDAWDIACMHAFMDTLIN